MGFRIVSDVLDIRHVLLVQLCASKTTHDENITFCMTRKLQYCTPEPPPKLRKSHRDLHSRENAIDSQMKACVGFRASGVRSLVQDV